MKSFIKTIHKIFKHRIKCYGALMLILVFALALGSFSTSLSTQAQENQKVWSQKYGKMLYYMLIGSNEYYKLLGELPQILSKLEKSKCDKFLKTNYIQTDSYRRGDRIWLGTPEYYQVINDISHGELKKKCLAGVAAGTAPGIEFYAQKLKDYSSGIGTKSKINLDEYGLEVGDPEALRIGSESYGNFDGPSYKEYLDIYKNNTDKDQSEFPAREEIIGPDGMNEKGLERTLDSAFEKNGVGPKFFNTVGKVMDYFQDFTEKNAFGDENFYSGNEELPEDISVGEGESIESDDEEIPSFKDILATVGGKQAGLSNEMQDLFAEIEGRKKVGKEILYHPNGEPLSWAMFYKFLAEKKGVSQKLINKISYNVARANPDAEQTWYQGYEAWFREEYEDYPFYKASDNADLFIVKTFYGGLPEGVTLGAALHGSAEKDKSLDTDKTKAQDYEPIDFVAEDNSDAAALLLTQTDESREYLFLEDGKKATWADLWPLIQAREYEKTAEQGGRPISLIDEQGVPWSFWFDEYFPEEKIPMPGDRVLYSGALFYLRGQLPPGSYGVSVEMLDAVSEFEELTDTPVPLAELIRRSKVSGEDSDGLSLQDFTKLILGDPVVDTVKQIEGTVELLQEIYEMLQDDKEREKAIIETENNEILQAELEFIASGGGLYPQEFEVYDLQDHKNAQDVESLRDPELEQKPEELNLLQSFKNLSETLSHPVEP